MVVETLSEHRRVSGVQNFFSMPTDIGLPLNRRLPAAASRVRPVRCCSLWTHLQQGNFAINAGAQRVWRPGWPSRHPRHQSRAAPARRRRRHTLGFSRCSFTLDSAALCCIPHFRMTGSRELRVLSRLPRVTTVSAFFGHSVANGARTAPFGRTERCPPLHPCRVMVLDGRRLHPLLVRITRRGRRTTRCQSKPVTSCRAIDQAWPTISARSAGSTIAGSLPAGRLNPGVRDHLAATMAAFIAAFSDHLGHQPWHGDSR
jgi:hypothetical protein